MAGMEIKTTLKPGMNGTKQLLGEYGDQLVCVRYRYDKVRHKRYKTVELIVEEKDWLPQVRFPAQRRVYLRIGYGERELREKIKLCGGYWNQERKAWHMLYGKVLELGLEQRILDEDIPF